MKTGTGWGLVGLALLLVVLMGWNAWTETQVDLSVARIDALAAGRELPSQTLGIAELSVSWLVKAALGAILGGIGTTLAIKAWPLIKQRIKNNEKRRWVAGPNANYGQRGPKTPTEAELMRTYMMQQMMATGKTPHVEMQNEVEPEIRL